MHPNFFAFSFTVVVVDVVNIRLLGFFALIDAREKEKERVLPPLIRKW